MLKMMVLGQTGEFQFDRIPNEEIRMGPARGPQTAFLRNLCGKGSWAKQVYARLG